MAPSGHLCGEDHPKAQLTAHDVYLIRELRRAGVTTRAIASKFETPERTIRDICDGRTRVYE